MTNYPSLSNGIGHKKMKSEISLAIKHHEHDFYEATNFLNAKSALFNKNRYLDDKKSFGDEQQQESGQN